MSASEITVTVKGTEQTYKQKFLLYDQYVFHHDDPVLKKCVDEALQNAKIEPEDIKIRGLISL